MGREGGGCAREGVFRSCEPDTWKGLSVSTYGTALVIDVAVGGDVAGVQSRLLALEDADVYVIDGLAGWHRFSTYTREVEITKDIGGLLELAGRSRAAVAEDFDEFGAEWSVLSNRDGQVEILHRHYILNADPAAPDEVSVAISDLGDDDPRIENVDGPDAATAAAREFDRDPAAMLAAEDRADQAWRKLGDVGGPFPWWDALELPWPQEGVGVLLPRT